MICFIGPASLVDLWESPPAGCQHPDRFAESPFKPLGLPASIHLIGAAAKGAKASNGETIAASEGYKTKAGALNGIESVKKNAPGVAVDDQTR